MEVTYSSETLVGSVNIINIISWPPDYIGQFSEELQVANTLCSAFAAVYIKSSFMFVRLGLWP
jgi:hypothetical protein